MEISGVFNLKWDSLSDNRKKEGLLLHRILNLQIKYLEPSHSANRKDI